MRFDLVLVPVPVLVLVLLVFGMVAGSSVATAQNRDQKSDTRPADPAKSGIGKYQAIIDRAPFRNQLIPQSAVNTGNPQPLRLNGIVRIGSEVSAGIEDAAQKKSVVVAVGQTKEGVEVRAIDEKNQTATVVYNGQSMTLNMEKSPSQTAGSILPQPMPLRAMAQPEPVNASQQPPPRQQIPNRKRIIIPREK
jgi:hypothetical protein